MQWLSMKCRLQKKYARNCLEQLCHRVINPDCERCSKRKTELAKSMWNCSEFTENTKTCKCQIFYISMGPLHFPILRETLPSQTICSALALSQWWIFLKEKHCRDIRLWRGTHTTACFPTVSSLIYCARCTRTFLFLCYFLRTPLFDIQLSEIAQFASPMRASVPSDQKMLSHKQCSAQFLISVLSRICFSPTSLTHPLFLLLSCALNAWIVSLRTLYSLLFMLTCFRMFPPSGICSGMTYWRCLRWISTHTLPNNRWHEIRSEHSVIIIPFALHIFSEIILFSIPSIVQICSKIYRHDEHTRLSIFEDSA